MVSRGFTSREFASRSRFAIKFPNPSDTMSACAPPFCLQGFPIFARNFDIGKLKFFYLSVLQIYYAYTYSFWITFLTHLKKDGHTILGLSSKVFTFDHLFTYIIQTLVNSLTISLTEWPENQKNRCLSFSANSVGLHFCDRVEKIKENGKKTKIENLQNGQEKYGAKKVAYVHIWGKLQKYYHFFKFQFEIALNGYLDKFLT